MENTTIIFAPGVDAAILHLIDYVDLNSIPTVVTFLERIQERLVGTLSPYPESGARFRGNVRMLTVENYTFLYEYHVQANEAHVLEMIAPGQDWR